MMKKTMKKTLFALLFLPSLSFSIVPSVCPKVVEIQNIGLSNYLARDAEGRWYAGRTAEKYGTLFKWTFVIGGIDAKTRTEALGEAYEALSSLSYSSGPLPAPSNKYLCLYSNDENLPAGAITPPIGRLQELIFH